MFVQKLTNFNLVRCPCFTTTRQCILLRPQCNQDFFLPLFKGQAQRDPVPIVYYNTMNVNMVNVDQTAGMTVVGDGANVTYDQRPQSFTTSL